MRDERGGRLCGRTGRQFLNHEEHEVREGGNAKKEKGRLFESLLRRIIFEALPIWRPAYLTECTWEATEPSGVSLPRGSRSRPNFLFVLTLRSLCSYSWPLATVSR